MRNSTGLFDMAPTKEIKPSDDSLPTPSSVEERTEVQGTDAHGDKSPALPVYTRGPTVGGPADHLNVPLHELNKASIHSLEPNRDNVIKLGSVLVAKVPAEAEAEAEAATTPAPAAGTTATAPAAAPAAAQAWGSTPAPRV
jgi:hypothetical protein